MKTSRRVYFVAVSFVALLMLVAHTGNVNLAQAQEPTTRVNNAPRLSLVPLVILNVGAGEIAAPVSSPTGAARAVPEFFLPRSGSKEITVTTSGGNVNVRFFDTVPPGVPASAFQWEQASVPAGNAVGRLRYSGCASCPASFTLEVTAASNDTVHASIKISLTASSARPVMNSISSTDENTLQQRFEIRFGESTFDPSDSQVIATYSSGLKYRLLPEANSSFAQGRMQVTVPRLEVNRNVKISLANPYGSSGSSSITLPQQHTENPPFVQVNSSNEFPESLSVIGNPNFSVKHSNISLLAGSASDDISIQPLATAAVCNQPDFIYLSSKASWLDDNNRPTNSLGSVTITSQPQANAPLRSPAKLRVNWTLNAGLNGDKFYQVVVSGIEVVGVCNDRVIH